MSAIFSRLIKSVYLKNFSTQRAGFSPYSRHIFLNDHVKWYHGIPGIPDDGKVVRLKNSTTGSELYLIGTCHVSKESAKTVKKVINFVRPDVVAVELCVRRANALLTWKPENDDLYRIYLKSKSVPGGLCTKIGIFVLSLWYRQLRADGIFPGQEFRVAMEETLKVKAKLIVIDQDIHVLLPQLSKIFSFDLLRRLYFEDQGQLGKFEQLFNYHRNTNYEDYTRSSVREIIGFQRVIVPEIVKVLIEDRDKLMFTRLRVMKGKVIVAVVGLGHMDGIELLWKLAEDDDDKQSRTT